MKSKYFLIVLIIFSQLSVNGCTQKVSEKSSIEIRTLVSFTGIELTNSANVYITQGDVQEIKVEAQKNTISKIKTEVRNGLLVISSDEELKNNGRINIYITIKDLSTIASSGSGNISTSNQFTNNDMLVRLTGSGNITAFLETKSLKIRLTGSGNLEVKGKTIESEINLTGSGSVDGKELQAYTSSITITGSGTSTVDVNNDLTVNITGSGNVFYVSEPEIIHSKINGSGKIEKIS